MCFWSRTKAQTEPGTLWNILYYKVVWGGYLQIRSYVEIWYMTLVFPRWGRLASFKVDARMFNLEVYDTAKPNESFIIGGREGDGVPQFAQQEILRGTGNQEKMIIFRNSYTGKRRHRAPTEGRADTKEHHSCMCTLNCVRYCIFHNFFLYFSPYKYNKSSARELLVIE